MNTSLRRLSVCFMALVVLLLANATLTQVFTADRYRSIHATSGCCSTSTPASAARSPRAASCWPTRCPPTAGSGSCGSIPSRRPTPRSPVLLAGLSSSGLERAEDPILKGSDERLFGRGLADFFTGRDPRGGNVDTTVKPDVQEAAWEAMENGCDGPCKGAVVALEPSTGKILAMVSAPSYDPNELASHDGAVQTAAWEQLRDEDAAPLLNRAIAAPYPPGSPFKVITTAAALQSAPPRTPSSPPRPDPLPDTTATLENYGGSACGAGPTASLREAFARSCNTAFVELGLDTGSEKLKATARAFGLDAPPAAIPLQVAESTVGPIGDAAALGMSSIGQRDVALTPLQNAMVAATIANGGITMTPYLVDTLKGPDLSNIDTPPPRANSDERCHRRSQLHLPIRWSAPSR
jgi:peptidoglycan glycosyltransferase